MADPIRDLLPDYAARRLDAEARRAVERHLRGCADCREALADWRATAALLAREAEGRALPLPAYTAPPARRTAGLVWLADRIARLRLAASWILASLPAAGSRPRPAARAALGVALTVVLAAGLGAWALRVGGAVERASDGTVNRAVDDAVARAQSGGLAAATAVARRPTTVARQAMASDRTRFEERAPLRDPDTEPEAGDAAEDAVVIALGSARSAAGAGSDSGEVGAPSAVEPAPPSAAPTSSGAPGGSVARSPSPVPSDPRDEPDRPAPAPDPDPGPEPDPSRPPATAGPPEEPSPAPTAAATAAPTSPPATTGRIAGLVRGPDGGPRAEILVVADAADGAAPSRSAVTGIDGAYALDLPPGDWLLSARTPAYALMWHPGRASPRGAEALRIALGDARAIDFALESLPGGRIDGRVTAPDGAAVPGALVMAAYPAEAGETAPRLAGATFADGEGRFALPVAPGTWMVVASADPRATALSWWGGDGSLDQADRLPVAPRAADLLLRLRP